jgi:RNA polymerase sigma factor (sigma-70 family)
MSPFNSILVPAEVIDAARAGDTRAHEGIFRACQRPVYTLIRRLISRPSVAEDLFQDTFVEILRSIRTYSGEGSFGGWVRSIAVNKCLMYLRSPWHRSLLWLDDDAQRTAELIEPSGGPEQGADSRADLVQALAALPALTRTVVWLHDVEGYTHSEIARLLGRTPSFSKSQLSRAHARLRVILSEQHGSHAKCSATARSTHEPPTISRMRAVDEPTAITQLEPASD